MQNLASFWRFRQTINEKRDEPMVHPFFFSYFVAATVPR
jgi:hypothetical protein